MNNDEIKKIIKIMSWADGGCEHCAMSLIKAFQKEFNLSKKLVKEITKEIIKQEEHYWEVNLDDELFKQ